MNRNQFTFYRSFFDSIQRIKKLADRAKTYDIICQYALFGIEPDLDELPDSVAIVFTMVKPNLESGRKKAESGKHGGSKTEANRKQTVSKPEANGKQEKEQEKEQDKDKEQMLYTATSKPKQEDFDRFWTAYPKKVGKEAARKAFTKVKAPVDTLISAVEAQKTSTQWTRDNGQYIPNPATWLNQGRWEDVLDTVTPAQPTGFAIGDREAAAIRAMQERAKRRENHEA